MHTEPGRTVAQAAKKPPGGHIREDAPAWRDVYGVLLRGGKSSGERHVQHPG